MLSWLTETFAVSEAWTSRLKYRRTSLKWNLEILVQRFGNSLRFCTCLSSSNVCIKKKMKTEFTVLKYFSPLANMVSWFQVSPLSACAEGSGCRKSGWGDRDGGRWLAVSCQRRTRRVSGARGHRQNNSEERWWSQPYCHIYARKRLLQRGTCSCASMWSTIWHVFQYLNFLWTSFCCFPPAGHFSTFVPWPQCCPGWQTARSLQQQQEPEGKFSKKRMSDVSLCEWPGRRGCWLRQVRSTGTSPNEFHPLYSYKFRWLPSFHCLLLFTEIMPKHLCRVVWLVSFKAKVCTVAIREHRLGH